MKSVLLSIFVLLFGTGAFSQSDYILLKKKNNRTLKAYFPGSYIYGSTADGAAISGRILQIKNDSLFIEQQNVRQVGTQFGVPALDTVYYTIGLHYLQVYRFYYDLSTGVGGTARSRGTSKYLIPTVMMAGGIGYVALETVNTVYRKESFDDGNKLTTMGVAAGVAAAGFAWIQLSKRADRAGGKYKVVYVEMDDKK